MLPTSNEIDAFSNSLKSWKGILSYSLLVLLTIIPTIIGISNSKKIDSIILSQKQSQKQEQKQATNIDIGSVNSPPNESNTPRNINGNFNPDSWYMDSYKEDTGFLCSLDKKSKYWSIWSKSEYPISGNEVAMRILIRPKKESHQTVVIGMGSYTPKYSPKTVFQLNIFENDYKSIRIYGENTGDALDQDRLEYEPDISKDIIATVGLRTPNKESSQLLVTLSLDYLAKEGGAKRSFTTKTFNINTQHVDLENGVKSQIGIGTSQDGCFRVASLDIKAI